MGAANLDYTKQADTVCVPLLGDTELQIGIREGDSSSQLLNLSVGYTCRFAVVENFCRPNQVTLFQLIESAGVDLLNGPLQPADEAWNVLVKLSQAVMAANSVPPGIHTYQFYLTDPDDSEVEYQEGLIEFTAGVPAP